MKMTKLLTGAASVALLTGAANAQIFIAQGPTDAPNTSGSPFTTGEIVFASEAGSLSGVTVPLEFRVSPSGTTSGAVWATTANVEGLLTVTFSGGVLDRSLGDDDIVGGAVGADTNCDEDDMTVDSDGAAGQNTVTFRIADLQSCDVNAGTAGVAVDDTIVFSFPVILDGSAVDLSASLIRASNNDAIASGSWSDGNNNETVADAGAALIDQASGIDVTVTPSDAVVSDTAFTAFSTATMGTISVAAAAGVFKTDGSAVAAGDIDEVSYACTFEDVTGLDSTNHGMTAAVNAATAEDDNPVAFVSGSASAAETLTLSALGTAAIAAQDVTCDATVDFAAASGLTDGDYTGGSIGNILRAGLLSEVFEWVGDSSAATASVFRMTGFGTTAESASVVVANSTNGLDGEYTITLPTPTNGEIVVTNSDIAAVAGAFGRADIQFRLHDTGLAANDRTIRRLMVGSNGTLSGFGNENDDDTYAQAPATGGTIAGGGDN